jgi:hypothetical protein
MTNSFQLLQMCNGQPYRSTLPLFLADLATINGAGVATTAV